MDSSGFCFEKKKEREMMKKMIELLRVTYIRVDNGLLTVDTHTHIARAS